MYGSLHHIEFFCTEIFCYHDSGADGDTVKESHHKKNQVSGRTDRSQSAASQEISYNQRIRSVIKLLKQISEEKGNGKGDNSFPDRFVCHKCSRRIFIHNCEASILIL